MGTLQALLLTFTQYVQIMSQSLANGTAKITNLTSGSIALAITQAVAAIATNLQTLISHIYNTERLATSTGTDVDSFVNDWGLYRLQATPATGYVTLSRVQTASALTIPITPTAIVQTSVNQVQFNLVADTTGLSSWDQGTLSYNFAPSQASIQVSVQAVVPGAAGNVIAGAINQIVAGFQGVNSVSNTANFVNGQNQETDAALRLRFVEYINSLDTSDIAAVEAAIVSVQPNLSYQLVEYLEPDLSTPLVAGFSAIVDDGTGNASSAFIASIAAAINDTRAAGSQFMVAKPTNETINVGVLVTAASGYVLANVQTAVTQALANFINTLGVGINVVYVDVANIIQNVPGVFSYGSLTVNGGSADITILQNQLARLGTVTY